MPRLCLLLACSMGQSVPTTMPARTWTWSLLLCLAGVATAGVLQARAQPDSIGFISIDCGLPGTASYVDASTNLSYVPDAGFTDAGANHNISAGYMTPLLSKRFHTVRSFPDGARNCYTLRSLVAGLKYIVRATFKYGDYDGLGRPPAFDVYVGVNLWGTVNVTSADGVVILEAIVVVPDSATQVCLVNTGAGTPFVSGLELRPLSGKQRSPLYPQVNATQGLVLFARINLGPTDETAVVRYPDDPYDRIWAPLVDAASWAQVSTTGTVLNVVGDVFEAPSKVMRTAVTPRNASGNIELAWSARDPAAGYIVVMHFSELLLQRRNGAVREFYINLNGKLWYPGGFRPDYLRSDATYNTNPARGRAQYNITVNATANSTLPPIVNAVEIFTVVSTASVATDSSDVSAMTAIKAKYGVQKNWGGDPCVPNNLTWDGLACSYASSSPPRITGMNLSFCGLNGDISLSFANLKTVQSMNLSYNNLTGSIPDALSQLPSLIILDLTGNQLSGSIPPGLLKRVEDGSLNLRYGNNPNLCTNADSCHQTLTTKAKKKNKLAVYIAVPVLVVAVVVSSAAVLLLCLLRRKKQGTVKPQNETPMRQQQARPPGGDAYAQSSLQLQNRRFTYSELEAITNSFQRVLGRGGFGFVYDGFLEDGTQVAVKVWSESSNQGVKEFVAEAQILARIHHKNLVSMVGYCKDGEYMALVYEHVSEGTLEEHIAGNGGRHLTWRQRLRIALESAQGLEYLHKACNPPLIHRDVKATNILLNEKLEAKIADFGLSKAFNRDNNQSHISTIALVGTPGYVDPEYLETTQPTTKSDVYSFGVVLLELVTGRPAILRDPEPTSVIHWARRRLAQGNIEGVVDARMRGDHDVNGVWKVADVALKCTAQASAERPTMSDVVAQLQECLQLGEGRSGGGGASDVNGGYYTSGNRDSAYAAGAGGQSIDVSLGSTGNSFEMERDYDGGVRVPLPSMGSGPAAR